MIKLQARNQEVMRINNSNIPEKSWLTRKQILVDLQTTINIITSILKK